MFRVSHLTEIQITHRHIDTLIGNDEHLAQVQVSHKCFRAIGLAFDNFEFTMTHATVHIGYRKLAWTSHFASSRRVPTFP